MQFRIILALTVATVAMFLLVWQIANLYGLKARGRRRTTREGDAKSAQRKSDTRHLRGPEKRMYSESQKLLGLGKVAAASRILEQLNMPREAIQALEDHGMVHDAAKILMRMQRHNRAGVVYARHGMWENAAACFKMANMPLEVAKCAREAGDLAMAAEFFEKVGRFEDAGDCYESLGEFHKAARIFSSAGQRQRSMSMYNRLASASQNLSALQFEDAEIQQITDYLGEGNTDKGLADVVVNRNKLAEVLINLVTKGLVKQAAELIVRATSDIGPMLMAEVNYQTRAAGCLAETFLAVSQFLYAGMVLERMSQFQRAGECFEKAEDYERAAYCYERAGVDFKVKALKEMAKNQAKAGARPQSGFRGPRDADFALANVQTSNDARAAARGDTSTDESAPEDAERTQMLDTTKAPDEPPARIPSPPPPRHFEASEAKPRHPELSDANARDLPAPPRAERPEARPDPIADRPSAPPSFSLSAAEDTEPEAKAFDGEKSADDADAKQPEWPPRARAPRDTVVSAADDDDDSAEDDATRESLPPAPIGETRATDPAPTPFSPPAPPVPARAEEPVTLEEGRAAFHKASFFADLDFEQKNKLWSIGATLSFGVDETVLTYNDEPRGVYVIVQGSVSCYRLVNGKESYVDQMGESESFGELWLLADQPTAVRFVASKNTKIRVINRDTFNDLLDKDGMLARKLYKRFTMRLLKRLLKPQNPPAKTPQAS